MGLFTVVNKPMGKEKIFFLIFLINVNRVKILKNILVVEFCAKVIDLEDPECDVYTHIEASIRQGHVCQAGKQLL